MRKPVEQLSLLCTILENLRGEEEQTDNTNCPQRKITTTIHFQGLRAWNHSDRVHKKLNAFERLVLFLLQNGCLLGAEVVGTSTVNGILPTMCMKNSLHTSQTTVTTTTTTNSHCHPPQALQSVANLGFQYDSHLSGLFSVYIPICYPIIFRSSTTSSVYPSRLCIFLIPTILAITICFGILSLFILSLCPQHLNLSGFIHRKTSANSNKSCYLLAHQISSSSSYSFMGPSCGLPFESNRINFFQGHCPA